MHTLLPSCYFGNIFYYKLVNQSESCLIEHYEHFEKQTFRNRCEIYGANGKLNLVVPVKKSSGERTITKDKKINNVDNWQRIHWKSLESAYRTSPYFEFYEMEFFPFFEKKYEFLVDLNSAINEKIMQLLQLKKPIEATNVYNENYETHTDFRSHFDPNVKKTSGVEFENYTQVFGDKHGFIDNLSCIDLLCNCGPESLSFL